MCRRQPGRRGATDGLSAGAANAAAPLATGCADGPRRRSRAAAAGRGPPGRAVRRSSRSAVRPRAELHVERALAARRGSTRDVDRVAELVRVDDRRDLSNESIGLPSIAVMMSPGCRPGGLGRAARVTSAISAPARRRRRCVGGRLHAEVGVLDVLALLEDRDDLAQRVRRDGEADADVAAAGAARSRSAS